MNFYNVPESLKDEEKLITRVINHLKTEFQTKCDNERKLVQEKLTALKNSREWFYSIEVSPTGWYRLQKEAVNPVIGCDDNIQWGKEFKIENSVLYHSDYGHNGKSWSTGTLPQGLTEHTYESLRDYRW